MRTTAALPLATVAASSVLVTQLALAQGPLMPPGPPAPMMKTLEQIEPRTPIASLPFLIKLPGSYYLTANLTGAAGQDGITIQASGVTLDLMGFELAGVPGSLDGVTASVLVTNIAIRNGTVRDWGGYGINAGNTRGALLEQLRASGNTTAGIGAFGVGGVVRGCTAYGNLGDGIFAGNGAGITESTASANGDDGIDTGAATVVHCTAESNGDDGIVANTSSIRECHARLNSGDGIQVGVDCTVLQNRCVGNGFARRVVPGTPGTSGTGGDDRTAGAGIHVTGHDNRIEGNHATENVRGLEIVGTGNYVADNTVRSNTDNYLIAQGNQLNLLLWQIPESIDWPAQVRLAGSLTGTAGSHGLTINAGDVTVDLAGHALVGVSGSLRGIWVARGVTNLTIRNGILRQWGMAGLEGVLAWNLKLERMSALNNGEYGFRCGHFSSATACTAVSNRFSGIQLDSGLVIDCQADFNGGNGIAVGDSSRISGCRAAGNGGHGISTATGAHINDCHAQGNSEDGINTTGFGEALIVGCTATRNTGDGIQTAHNSQVLNNVCVYNGNNNGDAAGIHVLGSGTRVEGNNVAENDRGIDVDAAGNLIIRNSASANTVNYSIVAGNATGPTVTSATIGASTNPHANYSL